MSIAHSIAGAAALVRAGSQLRLGPLDRIKYALSWYLSKPYLRWLAPRAFRLRVGRSKVLIRPGGVDRRTLADVFGSQIYAIDYGKPQRVLDLGGNIGLATLFIAEQCPGAQFACVEPMPDNVDILYDAIQANRINARVFEGAIGPEPGTADLHLSSADMHSLVPGEGETTTGAITVRVFSVPEIMDALAWDSIDVLKIDIEGFERTLFSQNAGWLSKVKLIIGEAHGHVSYFISDVRRDLEPHGFHVRESSFDAANGLTIFEARRTK